MATSAIAIVAGRVLRRDNRSGTKNGNDWSMDILTVLVAEAGTTEVIVPRDLSRVGGHSPQAGEEIAWTVEVVRSERGFNLNVLGLADPKAAVKAA